MVLILVQHCSCNYSSGVWSMRNSYIWEKTQSFYQNPKASISLSLYCHYYYCFITIRFRYSSPPCHSETNRSFLFKITSVVKKRGNPKVVAVKIWRLSQVYSHLDALSWTGIPYKSFSSMIFSLDEHNELFKFKRI